MKVAKWALVSVYDKAGIVEDVRRLVQMGWRITSSGGTAKKLREAGITVMDVADLVGGGAILGHRVVTLSREVHAGLLADALKPEDLCELVDLGIPFIDLVRCDFYPLSEATANPLATIASVIEKTDIGGPCMVRSGAKGLRIVVCRREDMEPVLRELERTGNVSTATRQNLRARAEFQVAKYVGDSAMYHSIGQLQIIAGEQVCEFKGENGPQVPAAFFSTGTDDPLALDKFTVIEGAALSFNNWCDLDRLLQTMTHLMAGWIGNFDTSPYVSIGAKHGNPCGTAVAFRGDASVRKMVTGDPRAIFGGIVMTNFEVTGSIARAMKESMPGGKAMFDGVIAPGFDDDAIKRLARIRGRCRFIVNPELCACSSFMDHAPRFRYVRGGFLSQQPYTFCLNFGDPQMKVYGENNLTAKKDLLIGWGVGSTSNSNTITIVNGGMLIGNGVDQQDRVGAAELAIKRAIDTGHEEELEGASAYSDSFFPFPDAVQVLIDAGVKSIFSTSGSVNDGVIQELCVKNGVTLYQLPDSRARGFFGH